MLSIINYCTQFKITYNNTLHHLITFVESLYTVVYHMPSKWE